MSTKTNILFTGVTGYIGGSVLARFLARPDVSSFNFTAVVRSPGKAEQLAKLGVNPVIGSHSNMELMEGLAADSDVVIATADADNYKAAIGTLKGLKKRHASTGQVPIFIHTSGTGVLADNAVGMKKTEVIYDDSNADQIETLPLTQIHRNVDVELVRADAEGYVKTYIILPSTIYGIASGLLVEQGIQNPQSIQIPALIKAALDRGRAGMVGRGVNDWPNVHIDDVADLYLVLFDAIRTDPTTGHGREGFYFAENGEHGLYEVGKYIGDALLTLGLTDNAEPTTFTKEELDKYFGGSEYLGSNSRARATRSRAIGWNPVKSKDEFFAASFLPEVKAVIAQIAKRDQL